VIRGDEVLAVLLFVGVALFVFVAAASALARRFVLRPPRPITRFGRTAVVLAALGALCIVYGRFVEPRWVEVTTTRVPTARLPSGHRGVRIVHLSDIHSVEAPLLEDRLPDIVRDLRPDLVVFTGDASSTREGVRVFRDCLARVAKIAPTFAVSGNHDVWFYPELRRFAGTGATELDGTSASVEVAGVSVHLVGAGFEATLSGIGPALRTLPADGPAVVLYHCPYPDIVPRERAARVDLICAGHTHAVRLRCRSTARCSRSRSTASSTSAVSTGPTKGLGCT
jgi:predicted MPP superfamily phosphohydrolase